MPLHNEYFCNAEEGQNKAAKWVGYILPTPLLVSHDFYRRANALPVWSHKRGVQ